MLACDDVFALCFADRCEAGRVLAAKLANYAEREDVTVIGLSNGGMLVAAEVAQQLHLELQSLLVRRMEVPGRPYLHMGAVAEGGPVVLNPSVIQAADVDPSTVEMSAIQAEHELAEQALRFCRQRSTPDLRGRTIVVVDDGVITGASMHAAVTALRQKGAGWIVVAVPVMPALTCDLLKHAAERVITVAEPESIDALDDWYEDFAGVSDAAVCEVLSRRFAAALM